MQNVHKHVIKVLLWGLLVLLVGCQQTAPGEALVFRGSWTAADGTQVPVVLMGTIHLTTRSDLKVSDALAQAITAMDKRYLEVHPDDLTNYGLLQELVMKYGVLPPGMTLAKVMSAEDYQKVVDGFKAVGGSLDLFQQFSPFYIGLMHTQLVLQKLGVKAQGSEMLLIQWGKDKGLAWEGLETMEEQFQALSAGEMSDHVALLIDSVTTPLSEIQADFEKLETAWVKGDQETLDEIINKEFRQEAGEAMYLALMPRRNHAWVQKIRADLAQGQSVFAAVGSGHLVGEDGLLALLQREAGVVWAPQTK